MIVLIALFAIVLFLVITKTQFFKKPKDSNGKLMTQLAMALMVGTLTIDMLFSSSENAFKYIVVGMGIMAFIVILFEAVVSKKKQTKA